MYRSLWAVCFEGRCVARAPVSATGTSNARWSSQLAEQMGSPPAAVHHDAMWHSGISVPHKHTRLGATACDPGDAHQGRPSDNPAPASQSRGTQHRRLRVHVQAMPKLQMVRWDSSRHRWAEYPYTCLLGNGPPCAAPSGVRIMHSLPRFVRRIQWTDTTSAGAHALEAAAACTQDL